MSLLLRPILLRFHVLLEGDGRPLSLGKHPSGAMQSVTPEGPPMCISLKDGGRGKALRNMAEKSSCTCLVKE